jgi:hypothetical protein
VLHQLVNGHQWLPLDPSRHPARLRRLARHPTPPPKVETI